MIIKITIAIILGVIAGIGGYKVERKTERETNVVIGNLLETCYIAACLFIIFATLHTFAKCGQYCPFQEIINFFAVVMFCLTLIGSTKYLIYRE